MGGLGGNAGRGFADAVSGGAVSLRLPVSAPGRPARMAEEVEA